MIIIIVLGLAIGSFINALVWRLRHKTDFVKERSVCEHCKHTLAWYDLIPVISWLSLKGKCRYCNKSISVRHPIVEISMASLFGLSYWQWPIELTDGYSWIIFSLWLAVVGLLVALALYDIDDMLLPDKLLTPLLVVVVASFLVELIQTDLQSDLVKDSIGGILIGGGIFYGLFQVSKGRWIGGGDVKLGFVMGAYVGGLGALIALLIGFYSAALYVIPLMAIKKLNRKSKVPFGPFLILGFFIVGLWGVKLMDWWHNWLGF